MTEQYDEQMIPTELTVYTAHRVSFKATLFPLLHKPTMGWNQTKKLAASYLNLLQKECGFLFNYYFCVQFEN